MQMMMVTSAMKMNHSAWVSYSNHSNWEVGKLLFLCTGLHHQKSRRRLPAFVDDFSKAFVLMLLHCLKPEFQVGIQ
jgi:hypothetical protein